MNPFCHAMTCSCLLTAASTHAVEPFEDVTEQMGLAPMGSHVANWIDFDSDGWVDLSVNGKLWRNQQGQRFTRVDTEADVSGPGVWGDFDNDGYPDYFTWKNQGKLFRNIQGQTLRDVGEAFPGIPPETPVTLGAAWADFDGDGFIDLYVGGYESWEKKETYHDVMFRNRGDGTLELTWQSPGKPQPARGIIAADYDQDGDMDVYVSNYRLVANRLWQNDGNAQFRDAATDAAVAGDGGQGAWGHTIGSAWGDFDNDGRLDLFVGNFSHPPDYQDRPKFLRNLGLAHNHTFEDRSDDAGLHWQESYASPTLGDFDNDGRLDLYFTTVYPGDTSVLYRNQGDWKFENVTQAASIRSERNYQAAWADFDRDGYLDLVTGGRLLRNPGGPNHWLQVQVVGGQGIDHNAIGTQVHLELADQTLLRQVESSTGQGNQNGYLLHFGLGEWDQPVNLTVRWLDGTQQTLEASPDTRIVVRRE